MNTFAATGRCWSSMIQHSF